MGAGRTLPRNYNAPQSHEGGAAPRPPAPPEAARRRALTPQPAPGGCTPPSALSQLPKAPLLLHPASRLAHVRGIPAGAWPAHARTAGEPRLPARRTAALCHARGLRGLAAAQPGTAANQRGARAQVSFAASYEGSGLHATPHQATLLLRHRAGGGTAVFADRGAKGRAPGSYVIEASPAAIAKQLGPLVRPEWRAMGVGLGRRVRAGPMSACGDWAAGARERCWRSAGPCLPAAHRRLVVLPEGRVTLERHSRVFRIDGAPLHL